MKTVSLFISLGLFLSLMSCTGDWSVQKKDEFKKKCDSTKIITPYVSLKGFTENELSSVKVVEKSDSKKDNIFNLEVDKLRNRYQELDLIVNKKLNINNKYEFYVPNEEKPYIVSDMKMKVVPRRTMTSWNYACILGEYKINGEKINTAGISIHKRKSVFEKECAKIKTFSQKIPGQHYIFAIKLMNFNEKDVKNIKIVEKSATKENTSFTINVKKVEKYYHLYIKEDFNVDNKYEFYIGNDKKPYILSDMKMEIIPRRTYQAYNYECAMNEYSIDGKTYRKRLKIFKRK